MNVSNDVRNTSETLWTSTYHEFTVYTPEIPKEKVARYTLDT